MLLRASHVLILKKKKVGVLEHLFYCRIADPSGRKNSQDQMEYCDTFTPVLPYVMIQCCVHDNCNIS